MVPRLTPTATALKTTSVTAASGSNVHFDVVRAEQSVVVRQRLLKTLRVVELDVAEPLELVRFFIVHQTDATNFLASKDLLDVPLDYTVR
jgi:hypothetical protein